MCSATDVDGDTLTYVVVAGPANGTLTLNTPTGRSPTRPTPTTTARTASPSRSNDGTADRTSATVSITVHVGQRRPGGRQRQLHHGRGHGPLRHADRDGRRRRHADVRLVAGPAHGTVTVNANGSFTYTPAANYNGPTRSPSRRMTAPRTRTPRRSRSRSTRSTMRPVAVDDNATTNEDTAVTIGVLTNDTDVDGDTLTVSAVTATEPRVSCDQCQRDRDLHARDELQRHGQLHLHRLRRSRRHRHRDGLSHGRVRRTTPRSRSTTPPPPMRTPPSSSTCWPTTPTWTATPSRRSW